MTSRLVTRDRHGWTRPVTSDELDNPKANVCLVHPIGLHVRTIGTTKAVRVSMAARQAAILDDMEAAGYRAHRYFDAFLRSRITGTFDGCHPYAASHVYDHVFSLVDTRRDAACCVFQPYTDVGRASRALEAHAVRFDLSWQVRQEWGFYFPGAVIFAELSAPLSEMRQGPRMLLDVDRGFAAFALKRCTRLGRLARAACQAALDDRPHYVQRSVRGAGGVAAHRTPDAYEATRRQLENAAVRLGWRFDAWRVA